jgi:arginine decarboxylase-like protein
MGKRIFIVVEKLNELDIIAKRGKETEREAQSRHSHQVGQQRLRQMGRERRRCLKFGLNASELLTALRDS